MTLAQAQIAVAIVVSLIATWSGLLISVALLLPDRAARAEDKLVAAPWRSFVAGLPLLALGIGAFVILANAPGPWKLLGFLIFSAVTAVLTVGAAGLAKLIGTRIAEMSGARTSFGMLVRGSLLYSLAVGFPYVGWFLFLPLTVIFALGAGFYSLWPRRRALPAPPLVNTPYEGIGAISQ